jgi:hypothetical protein
MSRSLVGGWSSCAHCTPQRQQLTVPLAIGAWQRPHSRVM